MPANGRPPSDVVGQRSPEEHRLGISHLQAMTVFDVLLILAAMLIANVVIYSTTNK